MDEFIEYRPIGYAGNYYIRHQCENRGIGVTVREDWSFCPWCGEYIAGEIINARYKWEKEEKT